jgi:Sperm-tail PG-rich repeat
MMKFSDNPGPGSYNTFIEKTGPRWKLGTQPRVSNSFIDIPGPGAYECSSDASVPAFSMTARRPLTTKEIVPGPGAYSPKYLFSSKRYSVGNASRESNKISDVPGPATYSIKDPKTRSVIIGSSKRTSSLTFEHNPGPGAYEIKSYFKK